MRQSVYLALIGASSAIRISQTATGACAWVSGATDNFASGCTNGTAKCGSAAEKTANDAVGTTHTRRSCDTALALAQGSCAWVSGATNNFASGCTNVTTKCGSAAEKTANDAVG